MPALTLTVTRQNNEPVTEPLQAEFGARGGTIGRSAGSTLLLPDPERQISRTHAIVEMLGDGFVLRDQGSATPVIVNGQTLGNGRSARIKPGDEIVIAHYTMRVESPLSSDATVMMPASALAALKAAPVEADISMIGTVLSWSEEGVPAPVGGIQTVIVPSPLAAGGAAPAATAGASFDAAPPGVADTSVTSAAAAPSVAGIRVAPSVLGDETRMPAPSAPAAAPVAPPTPVASTPVPARADAGAPQGSDALLRALLEGAGVPRLTIAGGLTPEFMRAVGQMLRETVRGLLDLLQARAMTKREVRADATVIVAQDNNPLKFSPTIEAAMAHLLVPRGTGFMAPVRAVADAHDSLRSHQLAFMAGMQAGLASVLKRLDPHALEQRSGQPSFVASMVPSTHKARLWDDYALVARGDRARRRCRFPGAVRTRVPEGLPVAGRSSARPDRQPHDRLSDASRDIRTVEARRARAQRGRVRLLVVRDGELLPPFRRRRRTRRR